MRLLPLLLLTHAFAPAAAQLPAEQPLELVTGEYSPYISQQLPRRGLITEIVEEAFRIQGYQTQIQLLPWKRGYDLAKGGEFFGTFPYVKTPERARDFVYSEPVFTIRNMLFVQREAPHRFRRDDDLRGLVVCKALGYRTNDIADLLEAGILTLQRVPALENCFKMLRRGRVDLVPIDSPIGWQHINDLYGESGVEWFRTLEEPIDTVPLHLMVARDHPHVEDVLAVFNAGLAQLAVSGALQEIYNRHPEARASQPTTP